MPPKRKGARLPQKRKGRVSRAAIERGTPQIKSGARRPVLRAFLRRCAGAPRTPAQESPAARVLNLDTHIILYALTGDLGARERQLLSAQRWSISAIVFWEIAKLAQLGRIEVDLDSPELGRVLAPVHVWPLTPEISAGIRSLDFRSDPADEIISATSMVHHVPLVTRDEKMRRSRVVPLA